MKPEIRAILNEVVVQPLRQSLVNNQHCEVFKTHSDWGLQAAAHTLKDPDLTDASVLAQLDTNLHLVLDKGQKQCNSNFLALSYGYTYLYQRINAIEASFRVQEYHSTYTRENGLFIDVGCGVGALLLALRNLHENDNFVLNYRGYDIVEEVLKVNESFLNNIYPKNSVTIKGDYIESFGNNDCKNINHAIMVFSYIFSQDGIDENSLKSFKEIVDSVFDEFNLMRFYIVYINIGPSYFNDNFIKFMEELKKDGYEIVSKDERYEEVENKRFYNLSTAEENIQLVPGLKSTSKIHCTVSEIRRV